MEAERTEPIRRAVASGDFQKAGRLWNVYSQSILASIEGGVCTEACMAEARELVEWSRCTILCARAHAQEQLKALRVAGRYERSPQPPSPFLSAIL
ncbi:MAG TPA: hypothetical protein VLY04_14230 [Bryobacteraceae bacterium]|nr:hypothetical protein [Bryobacteraceae bacterium]